MKRTEADCIIIGAGPAGLKAGTILQSLGYKIFILEKEYQPGGKLLLWNTLFPHDESAMEILNPLLKDQKKNIMTSVQIETITKSPEEFTVADQNQTIYTSPALFISTGFKPFNAGRKEEYGYGIYDNVITSVELEDKLKNNNITMTNGKVPGKVAMIHCVGSRDIKVGNEYCSSVCCITGIKQAMELGKRIPGIQVSCLYMDLRLNGRFYEDNYKMAQMSHKIQFIRGRLSETNEDVDGSLVIRYEDTLAGKPAKMIVDMIVLLVGMQLDKSVSRICPLINEQTGTDGFFGTGKIDFSSNPQKDGLFFAGACTGPKNITESMNEASRVAFEVHHFLKNSLISEIHDRHDRFRLQNS